LTAPQTLLSLRDISVHYGSLHALSGVGMDLAAGEIRAILGENGAGKTTLMNVVYGLVPAAGEIRWLGHPVRIDRPAVARRLGIGMVHQEFSLIDALTVTENLALAGAERSALLDYRAVREQAQRRARDVGLVIGDMDARAGALPVGVRQRVEILKALMRDVHLLILDEPTAVLTPGETEQLFTVLRGLRDGGVAILLITHKLGEVMSLCDSVTVLRGGRVVAQRQCADASEGELANLMVERALQDRPAPRIPAAAGPSILRAAGIAVRDEQGAIRLDGLDLEIGAGEIVGVAGVDGNGQKELFEVLSGLRRATAGTLHLGNTPVLRSTPQTLGVAGVAVVPPDRREGAILAMSVWENAILDDVLLQSHCVGGRLDRRAARDFAAGIVRTYRIVCDGVEAAAGTLSGGNLQKLIVGRALARRPQLLVAFNPTRGLDIGAAQEVHAALRAVLDWGGSVLLISTDLDEVTAISTSIHVLYRGRASRALRAPFDWAAIGRMMSGAAAEPAPAMS
jgi:simple sugar transport system ATP-binding protein